MFKIKSHKDSIRIVITHEDCGSIEILNDLWYNAISMKSLSLMGLSICLNLLMNNENVLR